jgi:uncharacterized membrane protein
MTYLENECGEIYLIINEILKRQTIFVYKITLLIWVLPLSTSLV